MTDEVQFENNLQPHRRIVVEHEFGEFSSFSYLIGNTKALRIDMDSCTVSPVRCLFLGSGDLRNMLHLIQTSSSSHQWELHLVDINPCVVARNILFIHLLNDERASADDLWAIWYDFLLEKRVSSYLQNLIKTIADSDLEMVRDEDRSMIRATFQQWLALFDFTTNSTKKRASRQRHQHISHCIERIIHSTYQDFVTRVCAGVAAVLPDEEKSVIERAQSEIRRYMDDGTTGPDKDRSHVNITMLQPISGIYTGHYDMHPYQGYIPFETVAEQQTFRKLTMDASHPLLMYCKEKLEEWALAYRQSRRKIQWHFYCGDALNLALFHMSTMEFDLIHTSNLCDHIDMLNLLLTCVHLLRHRASSKILTQSMKWRLTHPRFTDYISQVFNGIEMSWIPSLLGLICECKRTVGLLSFNDISRAAKIVNTMDPSEYQSWRLATDCQRQPHLRLDGTNPDVLSALDKIAERCFYTHLTKAEAHQGTGHSTTLTYYLLLRQFTRRSCVQPAETFEYLFQRTCHRFRAYAIGLRAIHAALSSEPAYLCTPSSLECGPLFELCPHSITTPVLQLALIECDESNLHEVVRLMYTDSFREKSPVSAASENIEYNLSTGTLTLLGRSQTSFKFHLLDNFVFKLSPNSMRAVDHPIKAYLNVAHQAQIQFILPVGFQSLAYTALLIDANHWFPFAKFQFTSVPTTFAPSMCNRDLLLSCFADICDRRIHSIDNDRTSFVRLTNAYETASAFHLSIQVKARQSTWTHSTKLISSGHVLILVVKFSPKTLVTLRFAFPCPLNLSQSKFEAKPRDQLLTMILAKDLAELISLTSFSPEANTDLFDSSTAKRWPPPRLADGRALDPRLDLLSSAVAGGYDAKTSQFCQDMSAMFTISELTLVHRVSGEYLFRDADFDLRESIRHMFLHIFCARQRLVCYSKKSAENFSERDIRTRCDILFLFEGLFDHGDRPVMAVSYLDMNDIKESEVKKITRLTFRLISAELQLQATSIAQARQARNSLPMDSEMFDIRASTEELDLMRKLLARNAKKNRGVHRQGLIGPWRASFVESLRADKRSLFLETKLTKQSGIDLNEEIANLIGCRTCKQLPPKPKTPWPRCTRCKKASYCSTACQKKDWPAHKTACQ